MNQNLMLEIQNVINVFDTHTHRHKVYSYLYLCIYILVQLNFINLITNVILKLELIMISEYKISLCEFEIDAK